jgi:hypothetical protein
MNGAMFWYVPPTCRGVLISDGAVRVDYLLQERVSPWGPPVANRKPREEAEDVRVDAGYGLGLRAAEERELLYGAREAERHRGLLLLPGDPHDHETDNREHPSLP